MALTFEDFVTPHTLAPLLQERRDNYFDKAVMYLRHNFTPALRLLDDKQVRAVAKLAYDNAMVRGIRSERDHLKYLVPVMFWGSYFEQDAQYTNCLYAAGWIDAGGAPIAGASFAPLFEQIDAWTAQTGQDTQTPRHLIRSFARIQSLSSDSLTLEGIAGVMAGIWPARTEQLTSAQREEFARNAAKRAMDLGLSGVDVITHVCLAQYFGLGFGYDPRLPWYPGDPELNQRDPEGFRLALGEGVMRYWDGLEGVLE